jgi:hypothetical protein
MEGWPESTMEEDRYNLEIMLKNTIHALLINYHKNYSPLKIINKCIRGTQNKQKNTIDATVTVDAIAIHGDLVKVYYLFIVEKVM